MNDNEKNSYTVDKELIPTINFSGPAMHGAKVTFGVGTDIRHPLFSIYSDDTQEPLVQWFADGTAKISDMKRLDEAATSLVRTISGVLGEKYAKQLGFVVRKGYTNEFLRLNLGIDEWTDNVEQATHFLREIDAVQATNTWRGVQVIPREKAMDFGGAHGG